MSTYEVHTADGSVYHVETADASETAPAPAQGPLQTLAGQASQALTKPSLTNPLNALPGAPLMPITAKGATEIPPALKAADKKFPAENLIPPAFGAGGAIAGSALPIPGGSSLGAGLGGTMGETIKQGVRMARGKPPENAEIFGTNPLIKPLETGAKYAAADAVMKPLTYAAGKIADVTGARGLAQKGFSKLVDKVREVFKPADTATVDAARAELQSVPAIKPEESDTIKYIKDLFGKKSLSMGEEPAQSPEASARLANLVSSGMSPEDAKDFLNANGLQSAEKSLQQIAKGRTGRVQGAFDITPASKYQPMGDLSSDLQKGGLTYPKLKSFRQDVADLAGFDKPDAERTSVEKFYGTIYNHLSNDMEQSAKASGKEGLHTFVNTEEKKAINQRFLNNIFGRNTKTIGGEDTLNFAGVGSDLGRKNIPDEVMKKQFGDRQEYVKALRDLADTYGSKLGHEISFGTVTDKGTPFYRIRPSSIIDRLQLPGQAKKAIAKRLGSSEADKLGPQIAPGYLKTPFKKQLVGAPAKFMVPFTDENQ